MITSNLSCRSGNRIVKITAPPPVALVFEKSLGRRVLGSSRLWVEFWGRRVLGPSSFGVVEFGGRRVRGSSSSGVVEFGGR